LGGLFRRPASREPRPEEEDATRDTHDASTGEGSTTILSKVPSRLFYSDHDDSDDSYTSRVSKARSEAEEEEDTQLPDEPRTIVRYRGFSTSLSSLFLDEPLVCASMGCFGLFLSNRTEYLLQLRQEKRGVDASASRRQRHRMGLLPSRIMAYGLVLTLLLIASTFIICGFGNGKSDPYAVDYVDGYDYDDAVNAAQQQNDDDQQQVQQYWDDQYDYGGDDANNNNNNNRNRRMATHAFHGVLKIRDYHGHLWEPVVGFVRDEWTRTNYTDIPQTTTTDVRLLEEDASQEGTRNIGADARSALLLAFLVFLGVVGRKRRMRTRYALVRARAQEDHLYYTTQTAVSLSGTREDQFDGACSHTLCGCYPVDPPMETTPEQQDDDEVIEKKRKHSDCISRGFSCFLSCCCGVLCKCWFQCLSVCALAQEAREMRLLLPPRFQRVDFITHQPFMEYQKDVNDLRRGWLGKTRRKAGLMPHIYALSKLSRGIVIGFTTSVVVILLTLLFNPRASFSWSDAIVLVATFVQSFLVLYVVHWIFHKSDLSLDAVIKFFAAGFLVAVPTAFFFEGLVVNLILFIAYLFYMVLAWLVGDGFVNWVENQYWIIWIVGELINAYLVAAVTEELCKYYTFRAVEHPDLIFLTGLHRESNDGNAVDGGHISYSYGSHQVSELNRSIHQSDSMSDCSHRSNASRSRQVFDTITRTTTEEEFYEDENDARTYRQKAAAVTTGMISVAVGLACAENFLYVFIMGGAQENAMEEWIVLLFRSIFPIHALSAAMQSINMIRKFVECTDDNNHRIGVGRILLPAVMLHGTFDAILLSINVFVESSWDKYLEENGGNVGDGASPYNPLVVNLVAWASVIFIMLMGIFWYYRENRNQRLRLILLEERDKARDEAGTLSYTTPAVTLSSEVELV
jgi:hypothetical protein